MRNRILGIALLILGIAPANLAMACAAPKYSAAQLKLVPTKNINQALFSEAMTLAANHARCKSGRKQLALTPQLTSIASGHSGWMARVPKLSHTSNLAGKARMADRVRSTGLKFRTAAENIAAFDRFGFPRGQFKVLNAKACKFATQAGKSIPAHSYASLAQTVVDGWMSSSGHKKNLLNRRMNRVGAGIAFDAKAPLCGRFYITQNYLG